MESIAGAGQDATKNPISFLIGLQVVCVAAQTDTNNATQGKAMNQPKPLEDYAMNALVKATPNQTMSSREIAQLTGKQHDNVLKLVRSLIEAGIVKNTTPHDYIHPQNKQTYTEYLSDKRDSLVVVARLSPEFTAAVIDRWQELEAKQTPVLDLSNPEHLRNALLCYTEKVIALEHQVETLTPKAMALDQIADTTSLFTIRQTAKAIKIKERDLVAELLRRGWAYRDSRNVMQPYAEKIATGYVTSVVTKPITGTDGQDRVFTQLRITAKGVTRLSYLAAKGIAA